MLCDARRGTNGINGHEKNVAYQPFHFTMSRLWMLLLLVGSAVEALPLLRIPVDQSKESSDHRHRRTPSVIEFGEAHDSSPKEDE